VSEYSTKDFAVKVEERVDTDGVATLTYRVRNRTTDVPEYEDYLLSRVIDTMLEMQNLLDKVRDIYNDGKKDATLLTLIGDEDDSPLH